MGERERGLKKRIKIVSFAWHTGDWSPSQMVLHTIIRGDQSREGRGNNYRLGARTQKRSARAGLSPKYQPARSADEGILMSVGFVPSSAYGD